MRPETELSASDLESFDTWRALKLATETKRAKILANVVGHPDGTPSVEELAYMIPSLSSDAIRRHLGRLQSVGVIQVLEIEEGSRLREYPYKFYAVTDDARELFDQNGLFPEAAWTRQYDRVEKTERIRDLEGIPRPE